MIAQEVSRRTFLFLIILTSQNLTPFRHICHPKPNGQAYTTFSFITSSIWNAGSQTYLTKDTAADYLIKSNTILIPPYPFLLRQFIYKTIFALSNSIFKKFRISSVGFCLALNSLNFCLLKKLQIEQLLAEHLLCQTRNNPGSLSQKHKCLHTVNFYTSFRCINPPTEFPELRSIRENYRWTEVSRLLENITVVCITFYKLPWSQKRLSAFRTDKCY